MPEISVIILNYNGGKWLRGCLDALAAQTGAPPFEILLFDNGSSDDSVGLARAYYPDVRIVRSDTNLGFAEGNNTAARHARGAWLAFLNNDTRPFPDWLAQLSLAARRRGASALVTSRVVFLDAPSLVDSAGDGYLRAGGAYKLGHGGSAEAFETEREVFGACGAADGPRQRERPPGGALRLGGRKSLAVLPGGELGELVHGLLLSPSGGGRALCSTVTGRDGRSPYVARTGEAQD